MLGDGGLADAEFRRDHIDDFAGGVFFLRQQFEDAAADGIREDVEGVHEFSPEGALLDRRRWSPFRAL